MNSTAGDLKVGFIGAGTIGAFLIEKIQSKPELGIDVSLVVGRNEHSKGREKVAAAGVRWSTDPADLTTSGLDVVVEAASHEALSTAGVTCLTHGIDLVPASVGALIDDDLMGSLRRAAMHGNAVIHIPSGGIGGVDAVQAAALAGLDNVELTINKRPEAWRGVPYVIQHGFQLDALDMPLTLFDGFARGCVSEFPQDVNIAAVLSLAGLGFDRTRVRIVANPLVSLNTYEIEWEGFSGRVRSVYQNAFDPKNPKTTYLSALSVLATLTRIRASYRIGT